MGRRAFSFTTELLLRKLGMPPRMVITGVKLTASTGMVELLVEDPKSQPLPEGAQPYPETLRD